VALVAQVFLAFGRLFVWDADHPFGEQRQRQAHGAAKSILAGRRAPAIVPHHLKMCGALPAKDLGSFALMVTPGVVIRGVVRFGGYNSATRTLEINRFQSGLLSRLMMNLPVAQLALFRPGGVDAGSLISRTPHPCVHRHDITTR
jgi:hypothetical protein